MVTLVPCLDDMFQLIDSAPAVAVDAVGCQALEIQTVFIPLVFAEPWQNPVVAVIEFLSIRVRIPNRRKDGVGNGIAGEALSVSFQ